MAVSLSLLPLPVCRPAPSDKACSNVYILRKHRGLLLSAKASVSSCATVPGTEPMVLWLWGWHRPGPPRAPQPCPHRRLPLQQLQQSRLGGREGGEDIALFLSAVMFLSPL